MKITLKKFKAELSERLTAQGVQKSRIFSHQKTEVAVHLFKKSDIHILKLCLLQIFQKYYKHSFKEFIKVQKELSFDPLPSSVEGAVKDTVKEVFNLRIEAKYMKTQKIGSVWLNRVEVQALNEADRKISEERSLAYVVGASQKLAMIHLSNESCRQLLIMGNFVEDKPGTKQPGEQIVRRTLARLESIGAVERNGFMSTYGRDLCPEKVRELLE